MVYKQEVSAIFSNVPSEALERSQSCSRLCQSKILVTLHVTEQSLYEQYLHVQVCRTQRVSFYGAAWFFQGCSAVLVLSVGNSLSFND